jgi:hypothetical protein
MKRKEKVVEETRFSCSQTQLDSEGDERIYVVIADVINPMGVRVEQPLGRQAVQGGHAVSKVRHMMLFRGGRRPKPQLFTGITTISLSARNALEMFHVSRLLDKANIQHEFFFDRNVEAYGCDGRFHTALATEPVLSGAVFGILDYLPLWASVDHLRFHVAR